MPAAACVRASAAPSPSAGRETPEEERGRLGGRGPEPPGTSPRKPLTWCPLARVRGAEAGRAGRPSALRPVSSPPRADRDPPTSGSGVSRPPLRAAPAVDDPALIIRAPPAPSTVWSADMRREGGPEAGGEGARAGGGAVAGRGVSVALACRPLVAAFALATVFTCMRVRACAWG